MPAATAELVYQRLAPVYDAIYGAMLQPGRRRATAHLAPRAGERILEIGIGTGFGIGQYPAGCQVIGIDLSGSMMHRARRRLRRHAVARVSLGRMDAARLAFPAEVFDAVYAPYLINVVPDPVAVAREMIRVCRAGGRLVFLNHFEGVPGIPRGIDWVAGQAATRISGVNWHLDLDGFMQESGLVPRLIESVNIPRVSAVVVCRRPA